jgi:hypothetical protein
MKRTSVRAVPTGLSPVVRVYEVYCSGMVAWLKTGSARLIKLPLES